MVDSLLWDLRLGYSCKFIENIMCDVTSGSCVDFVKLGDSIGVILNIAQPNAGILTA